MDNGGKKGMERSYGVALWYPMYFGQLMSQKNMADSERHCNGSVTQRSVCPEWNNVVLLTSELYPCSRNPPLMARIGGAVIGTLVNPQLLLVASLYFFLQDYSFALSIYTNQ